MKNGKFISDDLGWPEYYNGYFDDDKRYEDICASSLGHSVPIVNGKAQCAGTDSFAKILCADGNAFEIDMTNAYSQSPGAFVKRSFLLEKNGLLVCDTFADNTQAHERIVTREKPQVCEDTVRIADTAVKCSLNCEISVTSKEYSPRFSSFTEGISETETAYLVDFVPIDFNGGDIVITFADIDAWK